MALSKSTITGRVPLPSDENLQFAELTFALSGLDTEGASVLPGGVSTRIVLIDSDIPAGFELWQNTAGLRGTHYRVLARWTVKDRDGIRDQYADLGVIQIGSDPSYTLADLINNGVLPAIGTFWSAITQAQYDAVIQAAADAQASAADAQASATAAAMYDGLWLDTVSALIADTSLTYTAAQPSTVTAGDYVRTRSEGFAYQVAASSATDHHVITAGGVKGYVMPNDDGAYNVTAFGALPDGVTDCTPVLAKVRAVAAQRAFAGNTTAIIWPTGRYAYSVSPNWAITGLEMRFVGEVWLIYSGTDMAFIVDGGASGAGSFGLKITGKPRIYADGTSTHGVFLRAIYNSVLEFNVRGGGTNGLFAAWLVDNDLHITMSGNEGGLYHEPSAALVFMTTRGAGEESSYNRVTLQIGGPVDGATPHAGRGLYLDAALGNTFFGTVQNCDVGAQLTVNAWENKFIGMDFEGNTVDVQDGARRSLWLGCDTDTQFDVGASATGCEIRSGRVEKISVASGAIGTVLATRYNRTGTGTITDAGTKTYYDPALYNIQTQTFGKPKSATVLTVTSPSFGYTNPMANDVQVSVYAGTVTGIIFSHAGGYYTGLTQGLFTVPPGSTITVESTVAPQMVVFA